MAAPWHRGRESQRVKKLAGPFFRASAPLSADGRRSHGRTCLCRWRWCLGARRMSASHACNERARDRRALASPALATSARASLGHPCHPSSRGSPQPAARVFPYDPAPSGAGLAHAWQSKLFGQVSPRCRAFGETVRSQGLTLRGFTPWGGSGGCVGGVLVSPVTLQAGLLLSAPTQLPVDFPSHRPLLLPQEKERNAKRKKKKGTAVQNEEAAFPPAAEDEEMEVSGTSGNEEEMAEEAEGEASRGLSWGAALSSPAFAARAQQRHRTRPLRGRGCQRSRGVASVTPKPHQGDGILQHVVLVAFLDASGFQACEECPGSLPSSHVCWDRWLFWGAIWLLISISMLSKSSQLTRAWHACVLSEITFPRVFLQRRVPMCSAASESHCRGLSRSLAWAQGEINH